jgi:uncharacterized metal-binding protein YceD (DUF177 family)
MSDFSLIIRFDDIKSTPRAFEGELKDELVAEAVDHLAGKCGYFPAGKTVVAGEIYVTASGEAIAQGTLTTSLKFKCVSCGKEHILALEIEDQLIIVPKNHDLAADLDDADLIGEGMWEDQPDVYTFSGHEVDLTTPFRETLIVNLSAYPRCEDLQAECQKVTKEIGTPFETDDQKAKIDPRWAPLLALKQELMDQENDQENDQEESFSKEIKEKDAKKSKKH